MTGKHKKEVETIVEEEVQEETAGLYQYVGEGSQLVITAAYNKNSRPINASEKFYEIYIRPFRSDWLKIER